MLTKNANVGDTITPFSSALDTKATVMTKSRFRALDPRVLPDMSAKVPFLARPLGPQERAPHPAVDAQAVASRDGQAVVVFVVQNAKAVRTPVRAGLRLGDLVELADGPQPGEKVVLRPSEKLTDGAAVKPVRR